MTLVQGEFLTLASIDARWGEERVAIPATPAAGEGFTLGVDPRWYEIRRMIHFSLATNNEAANRVLRFTLERSGKKVWESAIEPAVAAEKTQVYNLFAGNEVCESKSVEGFTTAVLPLQLLHPGDQMVFSFLNMKTTDKVTGLTVLNERYDFAGIPNTRYTHALHELAKHLYKEMHGGGQ